MFANLFGNYLVAQGKISKEQFQTVMEEQKKTRVKLGLIAVSEKMLTESQADEINRKQAVMDKRFGDIAVELGYLTSEQVTKLLSLQGNAYMLFVQTITDKGYLQLSEVETCLADFAKANNFDSNKLEAVKSGDIDRIVPVYLPEMDENTKELILVTVRTINRLISTDIWMEKVYFVKQDTFTGIALQNMQGALQISTGFHGSDKDNNQGMLAIADAYAGETFDKVDLDALDSIGEFINIVNGLFATSLSYKHIDVELLPPEYKEETIRVISEKEFCIVPLWINGYSVSLMVSANGFIKLA